MTRKLPKSDCTRAELEALIQLGESWREDGVICDLGCGNGGSTVAFAIGLERNPEAIASGQIHAFDWFDSSGMAHASLLKFKKNTENWRDFITLHSGDITESGARFNEPIEILFVDIAKSLAAHKASMLFLRHLTDHWVFLNQDAGRPHLTYIQYSVESILKASDRFEVVDDMVVAYGSRPLASSTVDKLVEDNFSNDERLDGIEGFYALMGSHTARNGVSYRDLMNLSLCFFCLGAGQKSEACLRLNEFKERVPTVPSNLEAVVNIAEKNCLVR